MAYTGENKSEREELDKQQNNENKEIKSLTYMF